MRSEPRYKTGHQAASLSCLCLGRLPITLLSGHSSLSMPCPLASLIAAIATHRSIHDQSQPASLRTTRHGAPGICTASSSAYLLSWTHHYSESHSPNNACANPSISDAFFPIFSHTALWSQHPTENSSRQRREGWTQKEEPRVASAVPSARITGPVARFAHSPGYSSLGN